MNFANFIPAILGILGLTAFNKVNGKDDLTETDCAKLKEYGFSDMFLTDFKAYIQNPQPSAENNSDETSRAAVVAAVLGQVTTQHQKATAELSDLKAQVAKDKAAHAAAIASKEQEIKALNEKIQTLSALPENDPGKGAGHAAAPASAFNIDETAPTTSAQRPHFSPTKGRCSPSPFRTRSITRPFRTTSERSTAPAGATAFSRSS